MMIGFTLCWILYCISLSSGQIVSPPYIIKQPSTKEFLVKNENTVAILDCKASGEPAPKYRWRKNGAPFNFQVYDDRIIQKANEGTLIMLNIGDFDIGQYQCFAENDYGVATSNSIFLRKATLNSFKITKTQTLVGMEGEPFKIKCDAPDGYPKPNVYWIYDYPNGGLRTINDSRIITDPEGNLWFSNLTKADGSLEFGYVCGAASPEMGEYKLGNRVYLKVLSTEVSSSLNEREPIQQYVTEEHTVGVKGKQHKLYCIFGGTPLPEIIWFKDGKKITFSERVKLEKYGKVVVIKDVDFEDQGVYTCEASNGVNEAKSYSTSLTVQSLPYFVKEPERVDAAVEGKRIDLHCETNGIPEPEIEWIYNGIPIAEAPPNPNRRIFKSRIVFLSVSNMDVGNYGCNASNTFGYVYKEGYINVLSVAAEILEPPQDTEVVAGQNASLVCRAIGALKPRVTWTKNNMLLLQNKRYKLQDNGDLHIVNVQAEDQGDYRCMAQNRYGASTYNTTAALVLKNNRS